MKEKPQIPPKVGFSPLQDALGGLDEIPHFRFEAFPVSCDVIGENDEAVFKVGLLQMVPLGVQECVRHENLNKIIQKVTN